MNELSQSNTGHQKPKTKNQHQELPPAKKKKHPYSGRVGQTADMMLQFYRAKLELPLEEESNIILEYVIEEDKTQLYLILKQQNFEAVTQICYFKQMFLKSRENA